MTEITLSGYTASHNGRTLKLGTWDSHGVEQFKIIPGDGWDGLTITATFVTPQYRKRVLVPDDGIIDVPSEATAMPLTMKSPGKIVFSGVTDGVQRITGNVNFTVDDHEEIEGSEPQPTPSEWEQFVARVEDSASSAEENAKSAKTSADNALKSAENASLSEKNAQSSASSAKSSEDSAKKSAEIAYNLSQGAWEQFVDQVEESAESAKKDAENAGVDAKNAESNAALSKSWAVGGTGVREGEDTDNAKYWCSESQKVAQGSLGWYESESALKSAHPIGENGQWAIIGSTDTIWIWDSYTGSWVNSGAQVDLSDYYTKEQANSAFATAAQGKLADSAVQTVNGKSGKEVQLTYSDVGSPAVAKVLPNIIESGLPGIRNLENTKQDLLVVNLVDLQAEQNTPMFFGSDSPSTDLINAPYTSGPFYGYRQVLPGKNSAGLHLLTVLIIETYPVQGRIWGNAYDTSISNWLGWKQGGVSAASVYDEMAAAYFEGVSSV